MHVLTKTARALVACAFVVVAARAGDAELSRSQVTTSLQRIVSVASDIAAGKYPTKASLRGPARTIAIEWAKSEPVLVRRNSIIVETRFANRSVREFERNWKTPARARTDAKDVADMVASLLSNRKAFASPIPR